MGDTAIDAVRESYDRIADDYARRLFKELEGKPLDRQLLDRFAAAMKGRGGVCDMGCGPGHVSRYLHDAGANVFGLDLSEGMLAQARELNPDIVFRQGNMLSLELADESLAGISAFYAIVNLQPKQLPAVFREMARVLKPGGMLLLAFHAGDEVIEVKELWGQPVSMAFFYFQPMTVKQFIEDAGLTVEEIIERGPYAPEIEHQSRRAYIFARKPVERGIACVE